MVIEVLLESKKGIPAWSVMISGLYDKSVWVIGNGKSIENIWTMSFSNDRKLKGDSLPALQYVPFFNRGLAYSTGK